MAVIGITRPIPANVLKLIGDNQAPALLEANGGQALAPFIEFNKARPKDPHFPFVTCYRRRTGKIDQTEGQVKTFRAEFAIEVGCEGDTADAVQEELEIRCDAVDSIILTALEADYGALLEGLNDEIKGLFSFDVTEWVNGNNVPQGAGHIIVGAATLIAEI